MLKLTFALLGLVTIRAQYQNSAPSPSFKPVQIQDVNFSKDLSCYNCISRDYIYCLKTTKKDNTLLHVQQGAVPPPSTCCQNYFDCPELMNEAEWQCSLSYADKILALRMCPFKNEACGSKGDVVFAKTGEKLDFKMNLSPGDVCVYTVRAECGVPAFKVDGTNVWDLDV